MSTPKRATVYFEAEVHKALRIRAAANDRSISDLVNDAVPVSLAEDAADLSAFDRRKQGAQRFLRQLRAGHEASWAYIAF